MDLDEIFRIVQSCSREKEDVASASFPDADIPGKRMSRLPGIMAVF